MIVRVDCDNRMGMGHAMRCLALAQAWRDAGRECVFAIAGEVPSFEKRLREERIEVERLAVKPGGSDDAERTHALADRIDADWIVVDGYHFDAGYQDSLARRGRKLFWIDDCGLLEHYRADCVLNQNVHAHPDLYRNRSPKTQLLLGTRYILLRREFRKWRDWKRDVPDVARKLLVTLGGSDPDNVTGKAVRALDRLDVGPLEIKVVAGAANRQYEQLRDLCGSSTKSMHLQRNVTNMPKLMAWADVAVTAGGSTCWEIAFMGLPALTLILADNQRPVAEHLDERGVARNLGWHRSVSTEEIAGSLDVLCRDKEERMAMAARGRTLVDGRGARRIVGNLQEQVSIALRHASSEDCTLLWQWANEAAVRASAFHSRYIPWDRHVAWFQRKQTDPACFHFIAEDSQGRPVGQIRFDLDDGIAKVDVSVEKSTRGRNVGSRVIRHGVEALLKVTEVRRVDAFVMNGNEASLQAFFKAGFHTAAASDAPPSATSDVPPSATHLTWRSHGPSQPES